MSMPVLKLRQVVGFPGNVYGGTGTAVSKVNGNYTIDLDYSDFAALPSLPISPTNYVLTYDTATQVYVLAPTSSVTGISDAPNDGHQYGRQSAAWTQVIPAVAKAGDTMTGALAIQAADPAIVMNKSTGAHGNYIYGQAGGNSRWIMLLGDGTTESGGNVGSDFTLLRCNDSGTALDAPLQIKRQSGYVGIGVTPGTNPGLSNTTTGVEIRRTGTIFASCDGFPPTLFNINMDGYCTSYQRSGAQVAAVNVTSTGGAFLSLSDERLKEDLQSFNAGRIVDDTEVYNFSWKSTGERSYGVLAQQAVDVYPAAVHHNETDDWWGINYQAYIPILLQEVKDLRTRVAELESQLEAPDKPVAKS